VPHTAVLHRGLFRGGERQSVHVVLRRYAQWAEADYLGEKPPRGLLARFLTLGNSGKELTVQHWDRFVLPSVLQVEYRLGAGTHFLITGFCTPHDEARTSLFAAIVSRRMPKIPTTNAGRSSPARPIPAKKAAHARPRTTRSTSDQRELERKIRRRRRVRERARREEVHAGRRELRDPRERDAARDLEQHALLARPRDVHALPDAGDVEVVEQDDVGVFGQRRIQI